MENIQEKAHFLKHEYTKALTGLDVDAPRKWGKMNVQQMIEHMSDYVRIASGRTPMDIITPADKLERTRNFLFSEKSFPENTPNVLMPEEPPAARHASKEEAIAELQEEIDHFFAVHGIDAARRTANPFFGELDFEQQVQLLHKHATHHLKQFGAMQ